MKINLPRHNIIGRSKKDLIDSSNLEFVGLKEISLSYVNTEETTKTPKISIEDGYLQSSRKYVRPYDSFSDADTYMFDKNNNIVKSTMKRVGDTYYYEPKNQTEFTPLQFKVHLEVQRREKYCNDRNYNIKVSAIETTDNQSFVNNLISIFADKYKYGECPPNVRINGGAKSEMSLIEQSYETADFVFIQSDDGVHLGDSKKSDDEIDFDYILDNHTNVWLSCKDYQDRFKTVSARGAYSELHMSDTTLYNYKTYRVARSQMVVWDQEQEFIEDQTGSRYEYEYLNEAILIIHKVGKGYIVVTPDWFINDLSETGLMVYEAMMKCYLSAYYKSREASMWITDEPVDYLSYHEDKFNRRHNIVTVEELMLDHDIRYENYLISEVVTDTDLVSYLGVNDKHELLFVKMGGQTDPEKKINEQSFYTTKHTVINYAQEDVSLVELPIDIEVSITGTAAYVVVQPFVSSTKKIHISSSQTFRVTDFATEYALYVNEGSTDIENTFSLVDRRENPGLGLTRVAVIAFESTSETVACDTRVMGGGLPDDQPDDYDMLDIGHINGRPYRLGSTLIIRVPKKIKTYEERIRRELNKHIAAGDEYVLVFE